MDDFELLQRMGLAIAIGAAVGVERHWRDRDEEEGQRTAGLRTFTLMGMLGGTAGLLEHYLMRESGISGIVLGIFLLALVGAFSLFEYREAVDEKNYSATSVVAAMVTFALGAVAVLGDMTIASAGGVIALAILASREFLHSSMRRLQWNELRSAIILLAMTFVLLPIVPSDPIGPFGGVSPSQILVLAIMLAGISFCGYVAGKLVGPTRGDVIAGAIGGLISSTAVAISFAQRSVQSESTRSLASGAISATIVSLLRTSFIIMTLASSLAPYALPPLLLGAAGMAVYVWFLARQNPANTAGHSIRNPFELFAIARMALLLVFVAFLARAAAEYFGQRGLFITAAFSGFADVDAVTVTVIGMLASLSSETASIAIAIAVLSNTIAKAIYGTIFGTRAFSLHVWLASAVAIALAGLAIAALTLA